MHYLLARYLAIGILLCSSALTVQSQESKPYTQLTTTNPSADLSDLEQLAPYFEGVKVVGMGESTHGTHEFFTMRHRVFRYLVEKHGFNTFFMEADFASCLRVNRYINGAVENATEAVVDLELWPWKTTEVVDLVKWMRDYNQQHPKNSIQFVGVDMQSGHTSYLQLLNVLKENNLPLPVSSQPMPKSKWGAFVVEKQEDLLLIEEAYKQLESIDRSSISTKDQQNYQWLLRHLEQWIGSQKEQKSFYFRDICMGENVAKHLEEDPLIKGFFWAHNGHVVGLTFKKYGTPKWRGFAGGCLKHFLGNQYFCIAQDFYEGEFNAYYPSTNDGGTELEGRMYTLGPIKVDPLPEAFFATHYKNTELPVFVDLSLFPKNDVLDINGIGADYSPEPGIKKSSEIAYRTSRYRVGQFDAIFLIKKSTPTQLIDPTN